MSDANAIEVNGTRLWVRERGTGRPVVLVHGSASDWRTWRATQDALEDDFRTVAYSRRYHRPNDPIPPEADYLMEEHVDDLAAVIESLGEPVSVVGHSYGALVALSLAIRHQQPIERLILTEPPAVAMFVSDPPRPGELWRLLMSRPRTALGIVKLGALGLAPARAALGRGDLERALDVFGAASLGAGSYRRLSEERKAQARENLIPAELLGSGLPRLDPADVAAVDVPVLLVGSSYGPKLFHVLLDALEELLPNSVRVQIPASSHIVQEDNPEGFAQEVRAFLGYGAFRGLHTAP